MMGDVRFGEISESMNTLPKLESRSSCSHVKAVLFLQSSDPMNFDKW
jgi:hypothetical protein